MARCLSANSHIPFVPEIEILRPEDQAPISCYRVMAEDGSIANASQDPNLSKDEALKIYQNMLLLERMDFYFYNAQRQGRISFYMQNLGEEASVTGTAAGLDFDDTVYMQYREVGLLLYRGFSLQECADQCYGNDDDFSTRGRQMPVHYGSKAHNVQTVSSPLATQIIQAAGAAYALKREQSENVIACYFGEGAASEGDFHAALNFAATLNCPTLFLCRNNGYAISTPVEDQYAGDGIASRAAGYGIPTVRVDGNDVLAVYNATKEARRICVEESRPLLLEMMTYRVGHHSTSDDSSRYRPEGQLEEWETRSPIKRFQSYIFNKGYWTQEEESDFVKDMNKQLINVMNVAEKKPVPSFKEMFNDVYDKQTPELKRQQDELDEHLTKYGHLYGNQH